MALNSGFSNCEPHLSGGGTAESVGDSTWKLYIPSGDNGNYRCAQLDDYKKLKRKEFPWSAPLRMTVKARVSEPQLSGTWGFGLWNDPFSVSSGLGGMGRRFPTLPNTAWYFFASPENYLSFRNDLPAQGLLTAVFSSRQIPSIWFMPGVPILPLLFIKPISMLIRKGVRRFVREDSSQLLDLDVTQVHTYQIDWHENCVQFVVDDEIQYETVASPRGKLGFVLWIDNQYAAYRPDGSWEYGLLATENPAFLTVESIRIASLFRG